MSNIIPVIVEKPSQGREIAEALGADKKINLKEDKTNDVSLLSAMQNPSSKAESKNEIEMLRECGFGTPATRAAIIKKLESASCIQREKKNIHPTQKAFKLMEMLKTYNQSFLNNPSMTAQWEKSLQKIETDPKKAFRFLNKLNTLTSQNVTNVKIKIY